MNCLSQLPTALTGSANTPVSIFTHDTTEDMWALVLRIFWSDSGILFDLSYVKYNEMKSS